MQMAEVVLEVLHDRGRLGLPVERLYRQMFNPSLYMLAWRKLYANKGAMTPGVTDETADAMSMGKIGEIIDAMRSERYRFAPARRVGIPKKDGGTRPLGMPTWTDKLVGEVIRLLLEAYYEPQFSDRSHGFRPGRGCHTALREIADTWTGTVWFIEADVRDCFGSIDHDVLCGVLAERIHDGRFIELVRRMLKAGYVEDWKWRPSLSGAPQGGVASPILSNVYLDKLDRFVEDVLVPEHTRGIRRVRNPEYRRWEAAYAKARRAGDSRGMAEARRRMGALPSQDMRDPGYRRLRYIRYADDHLLGYVGSKAEAEQIKQRLAVFLRDELRLDLSGPKTLITHAREGAARFLGYDISVRLDQTFRRGKAKRRVLNGAVVLKVPPQAVADKAAAYLEGGQPRSFRSLHRHSDYAIVGWYGAAYRGVVNYYKLAGNLGPLAKLRWAMETSMLKTLAGKHRVTVTQAAARYKRRITTVNGPRVCFEAQLHREGRRPLTARFGEVQLTRDRYARAVDTVPAHPARAGSELAARVAARRCEHCGKERTRVEVHQVAGLSWVNPDGRRWEQILAGKHRKTLVVCAACHQQIHSAGDVMPV
jgi:group II intron reverse transcriptase/maturase